jgi:hypothetical protein
MPAMKITSAPNRPIFLAIPSSHNAETHFFNFIFEPQTNIKFREKALDIL